MGPAPLLSPPPAGSPRWLAPKTAHAPAPRLGQESRLAGADRPAPGPGSGKAQRRLTRPGAQLSSRLGAGAAASPASCACPPPRGSQAGMGRPGALKQAWDAQGYKAGLRLGPGQAPAPRPGRDKAGLRGPGRRCAQAPAPRHPPGERSRRRAAIKQAATPRRDGRHGTPGGGGIGSRRAGLVWGPEHARRLLQAAGHGAAPG